MKNVNNFGVFLIAVGFCAAIVLLLCTWFWLDAACLSPQRRVVMKAAGGVGCFEFWMNRYQSLIGGILALIGAGLTVAVVRQQIAAAQNSAARTARVIAIALLMDFYTKSRTRFFEADGDPADRTKDTLTFPRLGIIDKPEILAALRADESEALFKFALEIETSREVADGIARIIGSFNERSFAFAIGELALQAEALLSNLHDHVGWSPIEPHDWLRIRFERVKAEMSS